jgi:large subunit ribosomal protein L12
MEYVYAALLLHESGDELNEDNITAVLDAAGVDVEQSRVKALVAALEDVDIEEALETAAAVPAAGGAAPAGGDDDGGDEAEADDGEAEAEEAEAEEEDDGEDEADGEGLGNLFG